MERVHDEGVFRIEYSRFHIRSGANRRRQRIYDLCTHRFAHIAGDHRRHAALLRGGQLEQLFQRPDFYHDQTGSVPSSNGAARDPHRRKLGRDRRRQQRYDRRTDQTCESDQILVDHRFYGPYTLPVSVRAEVFFAGRHDRFVKRIIKEKYKGGNYAKKTCSSNVVPAVRARPVRGMRGRGRPFAESR